MQSGQQRGEKTALTQEQLCSWLQLIRSENVGPQTFHQLLSRFGTPEQALKALPELALRGGKAKIAIASRVSVERELEQAARHNIRFITMKDADYPPLLRLVHAPPPLLAVKGDRAILTRNAIGLVGSRNASAVGQRLAAQFAKGLGQAGFVIISGLARGIDAQAHRSSLETGTIAVLAGGLDKIYPPEHEGLYRDIEKQGGAIVSEMPLGAEPRARDFPRRNRLIAGIGFGTLVVEAARRSGSLITARLASENGRLVFAVPGSPLDPNAQGCNDLIKQGAILVDKPQDIVDEITPMLTRQQALGADEFQDSFSFHEGEAEELVPSLPLDDRGRARLRQALSPTPIDAETLAVAAELSLPQLYLGLLELDLAGRLLHYDGGYVSLNLA